jgi:hypothetical protein
VSTMRKMSQHDFDDLRDAAEAWQKCLDADPCDVFPVSVKLANLLVKFSLGKLSCAPINVGMLKPTTVRSLLEYRPSQLLAIKGFGRGTLRELQGHLEKHGLRLKEER